MDNVDWTLVMALGTWAMAIIIGLGNLYLIRQNRSLISAAAQQARTGFEQAQIMRLQFEAMAKERERPLIVEVIKHVLNPFIYQLNREIQSFEWRKIGFPTELTHLGEKGYFINDFRRKCPNLKEMVDKHNEDSKTLGSKVENLIRMVANNAEFREMSREAIKKHNEAAPPEKRLSEDSLDDRINNFARHVVRDDRDLGDRYGGMWKTHGSELFRIKERAKPILSPIDQEREDICSEIEEVEGLCKAYANKARELRQGLEQQREKWIEDFGLPREEIEIKLPTDVGGF